MERRGSRNALVAAAAVRCARNSGSQMKSAHGPLEVATKPSVAEIL